MLKFTTGDIFESKCEVITVTVNCVGIMGAGIAKQCKKIYPATYNRYRQKCQAGEYRPGEPVLTNIDRPILLVPTKNHWRNPSKYEWIEESLIRIAKNADKFKSIALAPLGCGHGGLNWDKVKTMIERHLGMLDNNIEIYEPRDHHCGEYAVQYHRYDDDEIHCEMIPVESLDW